MAKGQGKDFKEKIIRNIEFMHNKVIFDAINESLSLQSPLRKSFGDEPYL